MFIFFSKFTVLILMDICSLLLKYFELLGRVNVEILKESSKLLIKSILLEIKTQIAIILDLRYVLTLP